MNKLFKASFLIVIMTGCNVLSSNTKDLAICDTEVYELIKQENHINIIAKYQMDYISKHKLTEEEIIVQNKVISGMHEKLLSKMSNFKYSNVTKFESLPLISMSVEEKGLKFLCSCKLLQSVGANSLYTTT